MQKTKFKMQDAIVHIAIMSTASAVKRISTSGKNELMGVILPLKDLLPIMTIELDVNLRPEF